MLFVFQLCVGDRRENGSSAPCDMWQEGAYEPDIAVFRGQVGDSEMLSRESSEAWRES
jgi:hypothetical protein